MIKIKANHSRTVSRPDGSERASVDVEEEVADGLTIEQIQQRAEELFIMAKSTVFTQLGVGFSYDDRSRTIVEAFGGELVGSAPAPQAQSAPTPAAPPQQAHSAPPTAAQSQPAPAPAPPSAPTATAPAQNAPAPSVPSAGTAPTQATAPMPLLEDMSYAEALWWHLMTYPENWRLIKPESKKKPSGADFYARKKPSEDDSGKEWHMGGYPGAANGNTDYPATLWLDNDFMNEKANTVGPPAWFVMPDFG